MQTKFRRQDDGPSWKKVAHNVILVGSSITALIVGVRIIGTHYRDEERVRIIQRNIEAITRNLEALTIRIGAAERELDRRTPEIKHNAEEIRRLRDRRRGQVKHQ